MTDKEADLAGPGIGNYNELEKALPDDYEALLPPRERMKAVFTIKSYIEENLCKELNLQMVQVPLIVDRDSGVNDYLDRDGSRGRLWNFRAAWDSISPLRPRWSRLPPNGSVWH